MQTKIIFNGKSYQSATEMPRNVREMYEKLDRFLEDQDHDGIPDALQGGGLKGLGQAFGMLGEIAKLSQTGQISGQGQFSIIKISERLISVNGKKFKSVEEMPPEVRRLYEDAIQQASPGKEATFDESWRERPRDSYFDPHDDEDFRSQDRQIVQQSSIEMIGGTNKLLVLAILAAAILCLIVGGWLVSSGLF